MSRSRRTRRPSRRGSTTSISSRPTRSPRRAVDDVPGDRDVGIHPRARALVGETSLLHHAASGEVRGGRDADDPLERGLLEAIVDRYQGPFGGEPAPPPCLVQLEAPFDLARARPVFELDEADLADPRAGRLVDRRPRAEPVHAPLAQAGVGQPRDSLGRHVSRAADGWIAEESLELGAVFLAQRPQYHARRLDGRSARAPHFSARSRGPTAQAILMIPGSTGLKRSGTL